MYAVTQGHVEQKVWKVSGEKKVSENAFLRWKNRSSLSSSVTFNTRVKV